MFSGIVEETAVVKALECGTSANTLRLTSGLDHSETAIGDSIAINGVCLTVVENSAGTLLFDLAEETLRRTALADLEAGSKVNLERSLKVGSRVHGHFVFGHVDAVGEIVEIINRSTEVRYEISFPEKLKTFFAEKGSVCISGVSLTLGEIREKSFYVYLVPHTLDVTTLSDLTLGSKVNLEVDMLARYVQATVEARLQGKSDQSNPTA